MSDSNKKESDASSSGGLESFLSFLPVLMNSLTGNHNVHSSHSIPHHTHSQFLPPFLENLHEYWDYFLTTDFGKTLWENSGLSDLVKSFSSSDGQIQTKKIVESLKNNTFRRKWIKSVASFVAQWVKHFTDPKVQKRWASISFIFGADVTKCITRWRCLINFLKPFVLLIAVLCWFRQDLDRVRYSNKSLEF